MKTMYMMVPLFFCMITAGFTQVLSDFEGAIPGNETDGWISEGDGMYYWEGTPGNPGGCFRVDDDATGNMNRAYAPLKFLGNWSAATANDTLKADIFLHPVATAYVSSNFVFRIAGPGGQATALLNPTPPFDTWITYKVSLSSVDWQLNSGSWTALLQNVTTLIVTMEYITGDEYNRLDNVSLSFTPVVMPVVPVMCSGFEADGFDGWSFVGTGAVTNQTSGGNPGRYIRIANATPTGYALAPSKFLGDWTQLDNHAADIRFDLLITATTGTLVLNEAFIRISGPGGVARIPMPESVQDAFGSWHTCSFPVSEAAWTIVSGTWSQILTQVTELTLCLEFTDGSETVGFDNFCITNLPPVADFSADHTYTFVGNPVQFTDLSAQAPTGWNWSFGDNGSGTDQHPVHVYTQPGIFDVSLTVSNYFGSDTKLATGYVEVISNDDCLKYADDFSTSVISSAWTLQNGTWAISTGTIRQSSNYYGTSLLDACYAITGSPLWSDYYIAADLKSTDNDQIGLVFNFQDYQNMYMFSWSLETPGRTLYKWVDGTATVLASDNVGYTGNTWYQVKVGGINGFLTLTIDNQVIFEVIDTTFETGNAGLYCRGNQSSYWDNVLIECAVDDSLELGNIVVANGDTLCYEATQVITVGGADSPFIVENGGNVNLVAGQKISMLPLVNVLSGGYLHARISTDGYYCNTPMMTDALTGVVSSEGYSNIKRQPSEALTIFPNPSSGQFTLDIGHNGNQEKMKVEIYSLVGERVTTLDIAEKPYEMDLSDLPVGIYLVKVVQGSEVHTGKVVLSR